MDASPSFVLTAGRWGSRRFRDCSEPLPPPEHLQGGAVDHQGQRSVHPPRCRRDTRVDAAARAGPHVPGSADQAVPCSTSANPWLDAMDARRDSGPVSATMPDRPRGRPRPPSAPPRPSVAPSLERRVVPGPIVNRGARLRDLMAAGFLRPVGHANTEGVRGEGAGRHHTQNDLRTPTPSPVWHGGPGQPLNPVRMVRVARR